MPRITRASILTFVVSSALGLCFGFFILFRAAAQFTPVFSEVQMQFIDACQWGDVRRMESLHLQGASATAFADNGHTEPVGPPIITAAEHARPEAVKWLLEHGANWDVFIADGWTPLGAAGVKKREAEETIEILKAHGAKPRQ